MAMTLVESAKYSNDVLQVGVIEKLVYDDPVLERMRFIEIVGNGLTYDVETTMSTVDFRNVGDTWTESTSTVTQTTAHTKILGGDADVDRYLQATRSNMQDLMQEQIDAKTKALRKKFLETMIYGYNAGDSREFDGLQYLLRSSTSPYDNVVAVATSSGTAKLLLMERLEKAVDLCRGGKAELVLMTKQMRRTINKFLNGVGGITKEAIQGKTLQTVFDVPIAVTDYIGDGESADLQYGTDENGNAVYGYNYEDRAGSGVDDDGGTSIFCVRFEPEALVGVQSGGGIQVERMGSLETKDAERVRIKWYPSIMLQKIITCSKVTGIDVDGTVAA